MSEQIGPILLELPAQTVKTCSGCIYHKRNLIKSGKDPIYKDNCTHTIAPKDNRVTVFDVSGNLKNDDGNVIAAYWCPYLNKKQ